MGYFETLKRLREMYAQAKTGRTYIATAKGDIFYNVATLLMPNKLINASCIKDSF